MGLGSLSQAAGLAACDHTEREAAFYLVIDYIRDGLIYQERGRCCERCGVEFAVSLPPDAGQITVTIIDWRSPGIVITLRPSNAPEAQAQAA